MFGLEHMEEEFVFMMVIFGIVWTLEMVYITTQSNLFAVQMEMWVWF